MGRRLLAFGLSVAVELAVVSAPFVHAHPDDHETDHHRADAVHAHLSGHASTLADDAAVDEPDHDRAVFLGIFVGTATTTYTLEAAVATFVELGAPAEAAAHRSVHVVHGHDPPLLSSLPSRAPPAFLS